MHGGFPVSIAVLVSRDAAAGSDLVRYLVAAGFDVRRHDAVPPMPSLRRLVWITDDHDPQEVITELEGWLDDNRRAVVVTSRPVAFKPVVERVRGRLVVLAPPVFGWLVAEALRDRPAG